MAQTIKLKRSSVSGNTPSTSDLALGEVAINTHDGKMFIKKNDGSDSIVEIGGSSGTVTDAFKTIAVSGQTSIVADSATDTLTFVEGANMSITTSASGDSITFASTGTSGSATFLGLSDSPSNFTGAAGKYLKINSAANSIEFDTLNFDDLGTTPTTLAGYGITDSLQLGTTSTTALAGNTSIPSALTDLSISDGSSGQVLQTDGSGNFSFVNQTGGNSFGTIAVSGQSNVVADQGSDTLTLVAGSNITLTTNASGDSVTITSTASGGGSTAADAILEEYQFTATASQTTFTGSDDNSATLSYTANAIQVFLNGILLDPATDYTATNGVSIVLTNAAALDDYLQVVAYKKKISDGQTTVDTFTGNNSTTAFTLSLDPGDENNTRVFIDGVYQSKSNYSVSGTTLTFSTAPPTGTAVEVEIGNRVVTLDTLSDLDLPDNVKLRLGTDQDLQIYHDGSHSYINEQGTGNLYLNTTNGGGVFLTSAGENLALFNSNGATNLYYDNSEKLATFSGGVSVTGQVNATTMHLVDGSTGLQLGNSNDTKFFHDGSNSKITHSGSGGFYIGADTLGLQTGAHNENYLTAAANGAVSLYYDNAARLATTSTGIDVTGSITTDGLTSVGGFISIGTNGAGDDFRFYGDTSGRYMEWVSSIDSLLFRDGAKALFGSGSDLQIYHDGTHSKIEDAGTGDLKFITNGSGFNFQKGSTENLANFAIDGAVTLYYDSAARFATTSTGIDVTGVITTDGMTTSADINFGDSDKAVFGASSDLQIFHDGSHSEISESGTGDLRIRGNSIWVLEADGTNQLSAYSGVIKLYNNGSEKLATTSSGVTVTGTISSGAITTSGNFLMTGGYSVYLGTTSRFSSDNNGGFGINYGTTGGTAATSLSIYNNTTATIKLNRDGTITSTGAIKTDYNDTIAMDYAAGSGDYYKGMTGTSFNSAATARGLHIFNFDNDSNLGINFWVGTNASKQFAARIDDTGKVGIGTSSPAYPLEISGEGTVSLAYQRTGTGVTAKKWGFHSDNSNTYWQNITDSLLAVTVSNAGNVGIGVTNPGQTLEIHNSNASDYTDFALRGTGHKYVIGVGNDSVATVNDKWYLYDNDNTAFRMVVDTSGNVGIGTTSPAAKLDVQIASAGIAQYVYNTGSSQAYINFANATTGRYSQAFGTPGGLLVGVDTDETSIVWNGSNTALRFGTNSTERMRINADGNVGIGTTSPAGIFQVGSSTGGNFIVGNSAASSNNRHNNSNHIATFQRDSNAFLHIASGNNSSDTGIKFTGAGDRGSVYGTSGYDIHIEPNCQYVQGNVIIKGKNDGTHQTNVGIGTTSPATQLHVDSSTTSSAITLRNATGTAGLDLVTSSTAGFLFNRNNDALVFGTNNTEVGRFNQLGRFGIGTTSPSTSLHIERTSGNATQLVNATANNTRATIETKAKTSGGVEVRGVLGSYGDATKVDIGTLSNHNLSILTNNTERVRFMASGNIGIGTTSPGYKLDVNGTIRAQGAITSTLTSSGGTFLSIGHTGNENWSFDAKSGSGSTDYVDFGIAGSTRCMTWQEDGNVGIGTTNPAAPLHVSSTGHAHIFEGTGGNVSLKLQRSDASGAVDFGDIQFVNNTAIAARINSRGEGSASGNLSFQTRNTSGTLAERVRIDSSGNVGIGTTSPSRRLHVQSSGSVPCALFGNSAHNNSIELTRITSAPAYLALQAYSSTGGLVGGPVLTFSTANSGGGSATERMRINSSGNVGIGTSGPTAKLHLATTGSEEIGIGLQNSQRYYGIQTTGGALTVKDVSAGGTERMRIDSSGNVGIRNPDPGAVLDIIGSGYEDIRLGSNRIDNTNKAAGITAYMYTNNTVSMFQMFNQNGSNITYYGSADGAHRGVQAHSFYVNTNYNATTGHTKALEIRSDGDVHAAYTGSADTSGYFYAGKDWGATNHRINRNVSQGSVVLVVSAYGGSGIGADTALFYAAASGGANSAGTALSLGKSSTNNRSINAGGTVNASGSDYAEYIKKSDTCGAIAKGDICGIDTNGKLTDKWSEAHSFVVKSTDPSYVGGDIWGDVDTVGRRPELTKQGHADPDNPANESDSEYAARTTQHETDLAAFETALEEQRAKYDRIAFSGQVPCNLTGSSVGDYIIPREGSLDSITGEAVSSPTFEEYQKAVGKVWKVLDNGNAWISVKIG